MYSRKGTSPNLKKSSQKANKNWEICLVPKNLQGENLFEPCFQLFKINSLGQFESQQVYLSEEEVEALSKIRNTVIHDAENLEFAPIYEAKSGKESKMDQELDICNRVYEKAMYNIRRLCVTI